MRMLAKLENEDVIIPLTIAAIYKRGVPSIVTQVN